MASIYIRDLLMEADGQPAADAEAALEPPASLDCVFGGDEIVGILQALNFRDRCRSLSEFPLSTCKSIYNAAVAAPELWSDLTLGVCDGQSGGALTDKVLELYVLRSQARHHHTHTHTHAHTHTHTPTHTHTRRAPA